MSRDRHIVGFGLFTGFADFRKNRFTPDLCLNIPHFYENQTLTLSSLQTCTVSGSADFNSLVPTHIVQLLDRWQSSTLQGHITAPAHLQQWELPDKSTSMHHTPSHDFRVGSEEKSSKSLHHLSLIFSAAVVGNLSGSIWARQMLSTHTHTRTNKRTHACRHLHSTTSTHGRIPGGAATHKEHSYTHSYTHTHTHTHTHTPLHQAVNHSAQWRQEWSRGYIMYSLWVRLVCVCVCVCVFLCDGLQLHFLPIALSVHTWCVAVSSMINPHADLLPLQTIQNTLLGIQITIFKQLNFCWLPLDIPPASFSALQTPPVYHTSQTCSCPN